MERMCRTQRNKVPQKTQPHQPDQVKVGTARLGLTLHGV